MGPGGFFTHQSPLAMAAKSGSVATVSALLKAGADPNSSSTVLGGGVVSYSALGDAAANGHTQAVEALLACGPTCRSWSPLFPRRLPCEALRQQPPALISARGQIRTADPGTGRSDSAAIIRRSPPLPTGALSQPLARELRCFINMASEYPRLLVQRPHRHGASAPARRRRSQQRHHARALGPSVRNIYASWPCRQKLNPFIWHRFAC